MIDEIYFAPMEGIAGYIFRNTYNDYFTGISKYFSPFISTSKSGIMKMKEFKDIIPDNNSGINLIPQLLSNNGEDFIEDSKVLGGLGYKEVNINLGCPSGTVVTKGKGSGFLKDIDGLDKFFDTIFSKASIKISAKTRIGYYSSEEFTDILNVYNKYPFTELIIHPRTREDLYKNKPNLDTFKYATENSNLKLCYNGDIISKSSVKKISEEFSEINTIMIGRGILKNPCLPEMIIKDNEFNVQKIFDFHDDLYKRYIDYMSGDVPVLFKMKELWAFMINSFKESDKFAKKIKKSKNLKEYNIIIDEMKEIYI